MILRPIPWVMLLAAAAVSRPSTVVAWGSAEHQTIGRTAYQRACGDVAAALAASGASAPGGAGHSGRLDRLEIACGRNLPVLAEIYGDATAIAGDHLDHPTEFISQAGAWRFQNRKSYWLLALENSAHFNPMATRSWAEYHAAAVADALAGAQADGLGAVSGFQRAIQESAFADHFLQDAFAAGHMGFNRTASSAAAAKAFHDAWNVRGRIVSDRNGDRWVTFGDGGLDSPRNQEARRHVIDASTMSIRGVLRAFVLGERAPAEELATWNVLPFAIQAPEIEVDIVEIFERRDDPAGRQLVPLIATIRPVRKDTVLTATIWTVVPFSEPDQEILAGVGGIEVALPRIPAQSYLGAGGTLRQPDGRHAGVVDTGVLFPFAVSVRGLLSHQINTTVSWIIRDRLTAVVHAEYQLNAELGEVLVSLHAGVAELLPNPRTGWYAALGMGLTFSAAGGGAF